MFDPPEMVKYTTIPYSVVDSKEHHALALEATRKSIVLLKNKGNLLPLKKDVGTVAVIGPNSDEQLMLLGNYNGTPSDPITPLRGITEKLSGKSEVLFAQGCELVEGMPKVDAVSSEVLFHGKDEKGLIVDYYNNREFKGPILFSSVDPILDANWKDRSPRNDMDDDNFGVRWSGELRPDRSGMYQLGIITTCKVHLYFNDSVIADTKYHFRDEFGDPRLRKSRPIRLEAGKKYKIMVEAGESYGDAQVQLVWIKSLSDQNEMLRNEALAAAKKADVVVMCMGLTASLEGEEMDIAIDGFKGGDRTRLDLPDVQQELIEEIHRLGKPIVLVLLNGSALAINWEKENIPAILETWYPGQAAGSAIADVLFGDYNPGGRLPVTFYRSIDDLPSFDDYNFVGRTYRYFKGEPLYPFGYGLSYTSFLYDDFKVSERQKAGDTVRISVTVKNTGALAGDEVVQLYLSDLNAPVPVPIRALKGFKRIHLLSGEVKRVDFAIPGDAFSIIDGKNRRVVLPGKFEFYVGGGQPGAMETKGLKASITLN